MLDSKCKKIVKCCAKHYHNSNYLSTDDLQKYLKLSDTEIYHSCNRLNELGYFNSYSVSIIGTVHFEPGYKLFSYKEYARTEFKEFLYKSILVPIGVSIATSILTCLLLETLLPMILSLLISDAP